MKESTKSQILEELDYVKQLIDFHQAYKTVIWKDRDKEYEEHINALLDHYNELKSKLNSLDHK